MRGRIGSKSAALGVALGVALGLALAVAAPAGAADPSPLKGALDSLANKLHQGGDTPVELKADIERFLGRLETATHGTVKWDGADRLDTRQDGDTVVAEISNARISIKPHDHPVKLILDHVEIRSAPGPDNSTRMSIVLPAQSVVHADNGEETTLALKEATAEMIVDRKSGRSREARAAFAGARLADRKTGDWIAAGPMSFSSKLTDAADGSWATPIDFALNKIAFFFTEGPVAGGIDRIGYTARTTGPDLATLNRVRDRLDALQRQQDIPPADRADELIKLVPQLYLLFREAKGELSVAGLTVQAANNAPVFALTKASLGGALTGLSGDKAAWRITMKQDGLNVAPGMLQAGLVPRHLVIDFGLEDVATAPLHKMIDLALKLRHTADEAAKKQIQGQIIAAAAALEPVLRIYDLWLDTHDVGVRGNATAKGSPLSPKGFSAEADAAVRGIDAAPKLLGPSPFAAYVPVLKEIGTAKKAQDGTPLLAFHFASMPGKWLTINGNDVTAWFAGSAAVPGEARALRPAKPAMTGADVGAVQRALAAAGVAAPQNGAYDGPTAAAIAHFQKQSGLNVDGVADGMTRKKLGLPAN